MQINYFSQGARWLKKKKKNVQKIVGEKRKAPRKCNDKIVGATRPLAAANNGQIAAVTPPSQSLRLTFPREKLFSF